MKKVFFILILISLVSCDNETDKKNDSIIGITFKNYKNVDQLSNYTKVIDTVIYGNDDEPKHGILQLEDKKNTLVIFKRISLDLNEDRIFYILDTLNISNLKGEFTTVGYCQVNNNMDENLIAVVGETDSMDIQFIKEVWRANTISEKIERVNNLKGINCFNQYFDTN